MIKLDFFLLRYFALMSFDEDEENRKEMFFLSGTKVLRRLVMTEEAEEKNSEEK